MTNTRPTSERASTPADRFIRRVALLGINALAADETTVLIWLGPRGPEIFGELCGGVPEAENADRVVWLLVDAGNAGEADVAVRALEALLPRFPELHRDFRKESAL